MALFEAECISMFTYQTLDSDGVFTFLSGTLYSPRSILTLISVNVRSEPLLLRLGTLYTKPFLLLHL